MCRPAAPIPSGDSRSQKGSSLHRARSMNLDARKGVDRAAYAPHGLEISIAISWKSRMLRVATAMSRDRAVAAIWQSPSPTGRPSRPRVATISAEAQAALLSNGRPRFANPSFSIRSRAAARWAGRLPIGMTARPKRNSASVTAARNKLDVARLATQDGTTGSGTGQINSNTTLVSRKSTHEAQLKSGGSRIGPHGGSSSSTPPRGSKHSQMKLARFCGSAFRPTASRATIRASSSIE